MAAAADGIDSITVNLVHGQRKHKVMVTLPQEEPGGVIMNRHLAEEVSKVTGMPVERQKLIFKGKTLRAPLKSLKDEGITPGCKIMLLSGPKEEVLPDPQEQKLAAIEKDIEQLSTKLTDIIYRADATIRLDRSLAGVTEDLTSTLERLDTLELPEGSAKRLKRKQLVDKIHGLLKQADDMSEGITEKIVKKENKEYLYI